MSEGTSGVTEPNWLIWAREIQALAQTGLAFARETDLPADLSTSRVLPPQLKRMFKHMRQPDLPTDFD